MVYDNGITIVYEYDASGNRTRRVSTVVADVALDGQVDFKDFAVLAWRWLEPDCTGPNWCEGADIDWSGEVDIEDLATLARHWLEETGP